MMILHYNDCIIYNAPGRSAGMCFSSTMANSTLFCHKVSCKNIFLHLGVGLSKLTSELLPQSCRVSDDWESHAVVLPLGSDSFIITLCGEQNQGREHLAESVTISRQEL